MLGYIYVFSMKQKFPIRMYQEYVGLIFGRNVRMLSLYENTQFLSKKAHVHFFITDTYLHRTPFLKTDNVRYREAPLYSDVNVKLIQGLGGYDMKVLIN